MVAMCYPIFKGPNFYFLHFVRNVSRCKAIVNVVWFVMITLQKESRVFFLTLLSVKVSMINAVNIIISKFSNYIRMAANSGLVIPYFVAVKVAY